MATDRLIGRDTAGTGVMEEISLGASLEFSGSGSVQRAALTGDVTAAANGNATTIPNDTVTYAKMQPASAAARLIGRQSGSAGDLEELTATAPLVISGTALTVSNATTGAVGVVELATDREDAADKVVQSNDTRLDAFVASGASAATGLVPAPGASAGTSALLREDSTWVEFYCGVNGTASSAQLGDVETEVTLDQTVTIPANFIQAGDFIEIYAQGICTVQVGTDQIGWFIKSGSTTICNTGGIDPPAAPCPWRVDFRGVFRTSGASADLIGGGVIEVFSRASATGTAHRVFTGSTTTSETDVDTTAAMVIGIAVDRGVSDNTDSLRMDWLVVRIRRNMTAT
jgi:hypothetical protein